MITITQQAAEQIRKSAKQKNAENMSLRIAIRMDDDGSFEYGIGFDEQKEEDVHVTSEGIDIVFTSNNKDMLMGAVLDFVEIKPGDHQFIFKNPNDPKHANKPAPKG
jgi:iron-sulfur cluster assembly protein